MVFNRNKGKDKPKPPNVPIQFVPSEKQEIQRMDQQPPSFQQEPQPQNNKVQFRFRRPSSKDSAKKPTTAARQVVDQKNENWNLYTGDSQLKMNYLLKFPSSWANQLYDKFFQEQATQGLQVISLIFMLHYCGSFDPSFCGNEDCTNHYLVCCMLSLFPLLSTLSICSKFHRYQLILIRNSVNLFLSFQNLTLYHQNNAFYSCLLFYLPGIFINIFVIKDWIEYLVFTLLQTFILSLIVHLLGINPDFQLQEFLKAGTQNAFFYVAVFMLIEKLKKESFVATIANVKTKQILLSIFNSQQNPIAIVNQNGGILFSNDSFTKMIRQKLNFKNDPNNVFKLFKSDADSAKLQQLLTDIYKSSRIGSNSQTSKSTFSNSQIFSSASNAGFQLEVKLYKQPSKRFGSKDHEIEAEEEKEKKVFSKFEVVRISAEPMLFKSVKCLMLVFDMVSMQKAQEQLVLQHTKQLQQQLKDHSKQLEKLHYQNNEEETLIECLGSSYLATHQVAQIQSRFETGVMLTTSDENFLVKEEVMFCLQILSVKCLNKKSSLNLKISQSVPESAMSGDKIKFCQALNCVTEFAMKYCRDGMIDIVVDVGKIFTDKKMLEITLAIIVTKNSNGSAKENSESALAEQTIRTLLSSQQQNESAGYEQVISNNFETLFDLVNAYGISIVLFPQLVTALQGTYSLDIKENQDPIPEEEQKQEDQDNAAPSGRGKIKMFYLVPLAYSNSDKPVSSPWQHSKPPTCSITKIGSTVIKSPLVNLKKNNNQMQMQVGVALNKKDAKKEESKEELMETMQKLIQQNQPPKSPNLSAQSSFLSKDQQKLSGMTLTHGIVTSSIAKIRTNSQTVIDRIGSNQPEQQKQAQLIRGQLFNLESKPVLKKETDEPQKQPQNQEFDINRQITFDIQIHQNLHQKDKSEDSKKVDGTITPLFQIQEGNHSKQMSVVEDKSKKAFLVEPLELDNKVHNSINIVPFQKVEKEEEKEFKRDESRRLIRWEVSTLQAHMQPNTHQSQKELPRAELKVQVQKKKSQFGRKLSKSAEISERKEEQSSESELENFMSQLISEENLDSNRNASEEQKETNHLTPQILNDLQPQTKLQTPKFFPLSRNIQNGQIMMSNWAGASKNLLNSNGWSGHNSVVEEAKVVKKAETPDVRRQK